MPGIAGIVARLPPRECEARVSTMVEFMKHRSDWRTGLHCEPDGGFYAGWVSRADAPGAAQPHANRTRTVIAVLAGEPRLGDARDDCQPAALLDEYDANGERIFERLNGLFCGFLIDTCRHTAYLFNDRYGIERLYCLEADGMVAFASEAKALLRIQKGYRALDEEGIAQLASLGCTLGTQSLFKGIRVIPAASVWTFGNAGLRQRRYFDVGEWEAQPPLASADFEAALASCLRARVAPYFRAQGAVGVALTGGLDTRMVLAFRPRDASPVVSYTYDGPVGCTRDTVVASRVAAACGLRHEVIPIGEDFFRDFNVHADRTTYVTDGYFGPLGAHELYLSAKASALAPVRLTGVFGGEVLRGVTTLKPSVLAASALAEPLAQMARAWARPGALRQEHPVTMAAFTHSPAAMYGTLAACRSQLSFRTPFLDNDVVKLAFRAPRHSRSVTAEALRLVASAAPALARIPTDREVELGGGRLVRTVRRVLAEVSFKFDYWCNDGLPGWLAAADPVIDALHARGGPLGQHKYLRYRRWLRRELSAYLHDMVPAAARLPYVDADQVRAMAAQHVSGVANRVHQLGLVLTLEAIERLLIRQ